MPTLDELVDLVTGGFTGPLADTAPSDPRLDAIVDQAVARHRPRRDLRQLGAGLAAAGGLPTAAAMPLAEDPGVLGALASGARKGLVEPVARFLEKTRDHWQPSPEVAAQVAQQGYAARGEPTDGPPWVAPMPLDEVIPPGLGDAVAQSAAVGRDNYLARHPSGPAAAVPFAAETLARAAPAFALRKFPVAATAANLLAGTAQNSLDLLADANRSLGVDAAVEAAAANFGFPAHRDMSQLGAGIAAAGGAPGLGGSKTTAATPGILATAVSLVPSTIKENLANLAELPAQSLRGLLKPVRDAAAYAAPRRPGQVPVGAVPAPGWAEAETAPADPLFGGRNLPGIAQDVADEIHAERARKQATLAEAGVEHPVAATAADWAANTAAGVLDPLVVGPLAIGHVRAIGAANEALASRLGLSEEEILRQGLPVGRGIPTDVLLGRAPGTTADRAAARLAGPDLERATAPSFETYLEGKGVDPADFPHLDQRSQEIWTRRFLMDSSAGPDTAAPWSPGRQIRENFKRNLGLYDDPEAGAIRNPFAKAPEPPALTETGEALDPLAYDIRHNYVTSRDIYRRQAGMRFREIEQQVPDLATRQDMTALLQRTGNPLIQGDTPEAVQARIWASPYRDQAVNLVNDWRDKTNDLFAKLKDIGFADDMGYHRDYIRQLFEDPEEAITRSVDPKLPMSPTRGLQKSRTFGSYEEAMQAGMVPKSLDFATLAGLTEKNYGETMGLHQLMRDVADLPGMEDGLPAILKANAAPGPNYVKVQNSPILDRAVQEVAAKPQTYTDQPGLFQFGSREQQLLPGTGKLGYEAPTEGANLYLHKDLWNNLEPVLRTADSTTLEKGLQAIKRVNFLYSLFHGGALTGSSMKFFGPTRGIAEAAKRGFGVPGVSQILDKAGVGQVAEPLVEDAMRAGVKMGAPTIDAGTDALDALLQKAAEGAQGMPVLGRGTARALEAARASNRFADKALWEITHDRLKAAAYHFKMDQVTRFRAGEAAALGLEGRMMTPARRQALLDMPLEDAQRSVAKMVNDVFGGQNWELHKSRLLNDKNLLRIGRAIFQSPDWNMSALRSSSAALSSDPLRSTMGVGYLKNAAKVYVGMNLVNYLLSGHLMIDNQPGRKFHLDNGELGPGHRFYGNPIVKHSAEAVHLATDPVAFFGRKIASPWQGIVAALSGHTLSGYPSHLQQAEDQAHEEGREISIPESVVRRGQDLFGSAMPFNLTQLTSPREAWKLAVPMTEAKGLNTYDAFPMLAEAYRSGDDETIARVNGWLEDNGYDPKRIHSLNVRARDIDAMTERRQGRRDQREAEGYLP